jgi:hypothetical protein
MAALMTTLGSLVAVVETVAVFMIWPPLLGSVEGMPLDSLEE